MPQLGLMIWYIVASGEQTDSIVFISMAFSVLSIVVTVVSMYTAKSLIETQNFYSVEFDVTGVMVADRIDVCRNNVKPIQRQIEVILGLRENLVEITRPTNIQNGVRLHINVYVGYTKAVDMNIEKVVNDAKDSGQLSQIIVKSWDLSGAPSLSDIKYEMHESKARKKQSVNIQIKNNKTLEMMNFEDKNNEQRTVPPEPCPIDPQNSEGAIDNNTHDDGNLEILGNIVDTDNGADDKTMMNTNDDSSEGESEKEESNFTTQGETKQ